MIILTDCPLTDHSNEKDFMVFCAHVRNFRDFEHKI